MRCLSYAAAAAALLVSTGAVVHVVAGAKSTGYPVSITFRDSNWCDPAVTPGCMPGDKILSDGLGTYVDGVTGVNCYIRAVSDIYSDLVFATGSRGPRTLQWFYTPATDVLQPSLNPPAGYLKGLGSMVVADVGTMSVYQTRLRAANFNSPVGNFRFGAMHSDTNSYGSQQVVVVRTSATAWIVSTDALLTGAGDLDALLQSTRSGATVAVGLYHMPFQVDVKCLSATNCPPSS